MIKKLLLILLLLTHPAYASNGGAQFKQFGPFFSSAGVLYNSPKIFHYAAGTTTDKTCWSDEAKSGAVAQPLIGDLSGIATMYCDGDYKFVIKDSSSNTLYTWDNVKVTSDTATMWEGNAGTAYPSAVAANRWHLFAKHDAGNVFQELGINNGSSFVRFAGSTTAFTDLANTFTLAQTFSGGSAAAPSINFSGQTTDGLFSKSATEIGESINGVEVGFLDSSGNMSRSGIYKSTKACGTGLTRKANLCLDTDGNLAQLFSDATNGNVNDTAVSNAAMDGAAFAIVRLYCDILQDGTAESATLDLHVRIATSGDQTAQLGEIACEVSAYLASERDRVWTTTIIPLDASGDFEYETLNSGTVTARAVQGYLLGTIE